MPAHWYLIAGPTGAGKTTIAREIAQRQHGVIFSIDQWMQSLFWMDCPQKNDYPWAIERVRRCEEQIATVATHLALIGIASILDLGFTQRSQRLEWLARAQRAGIKAGLQTVDPPAEIRWQRVAERNQGDSQTFSFAVTREMFDAMEALWEPPSAEELAQFS